MTYAVPKQIQLVKLVETLEERIRSVLEVDPRLQYTDVPMGFTKNLNSTTTDYVTRGDFEPIGSVDNKAIIVSALAKYVRFGVLYDEVSYIIQPIDVEELSAMITSSPSFNDQYNNLMVLLTNIDAIIERSAHDTKEPIPG